MAHDPQSVRLDVNLGEIIFVVLHRVCHHIRVTIVHRSNLLISQLLIALNLEVHLVLVLGLRRLIPRIIALELFIDFVESLLHLLGRIVLRPF